MSKYFKSEAEVNKLVSLLDRYMFIMIQKISLNFKYSTPSELHSRMRWFTESSLGQDPCPSFPLPGQTCAVKGHTHAHVRTHTHAQSHDEDPSLFVQALATSPPLFAHGLGKKNGTVHLGHTNGTVHLQKNRSERGPRQSWKQGFRQEFWGLDTWSVAQEGGMALTE